MLVNDTLLRELKARAASAIPEVPSSWRCEAIARGFNYNQWCALLQDVRARGEISLEFVPARAEQYAGHKMGRPWAAYANRFAFVSTGR